MTAVQSNELCVAVGEDYDWEIDAFADGGGVAAFSPSDGLSAIVNQGEDTSTVFTPSTQWIDATNGRLQLTVSGAATANLTPGMYQLVVRVIPNGTTLKRRVFCGWLDLAYSPGTSTPPPTYCGYQDLLDYGGPWLRKLLVSEGLSGFLRQCARARSWLDDVIVDKYRPSLYRADLRTYGWAGFANLESQSTIILGYLRSNFLMVKDRTKEIVAHKAIGYICDQQISGSKDDPYVARAFFHHLTAEEMVKSYRAEIDINSDGYADLAFNLSVHSIR